jgi:hypothetical protein
VIRLIEARLELLDAIQEVRRRQGLRIRLNSRPGGADVEHRESTAESLRETSIDSSHPHCGSLPAVPHCPAR